eukprot:TRINITY_DN10765_c0_g1_i1.p1 TRINITY_DN10765_c0_g1~~TRINITY_DN10765_c0_g1_i1.p1  ORF type:complete len:116 (-),score=38.71 TRINITY_DN10765_c0_g1_i1:176-523(-)
MVKLDNDAFLTELTKLFNATKSVGSVYLTFKQQTLTKDGAPAKKLKNDKAEAVEVHNKVLIRATDGKKTKFSTLVSAKDVVRFQTAYGNIVKAQMDALKKKEKKKKKKPAAKATV